MLYDKNIATFMLQLFYDKNSRQTLASYRLEACNFIKKETLAPVFSCEFCKIYKNTFYYRTPLVAASGVLINWAILEPFSNKVAVFLTEYLWWLLLPFCCSKYFFTAEHGIYCRQLHQYLKTRVKPQK